jgi:hypothetical protein
MAAFAAMTDDWNMPENARLISRAARTPHNPRLARGSAADRSQLSQQRAEPGARREGARYETGAGRDGVERASRA